MQVNFFTYVPPPSRGVREMVFHLNNYEEKSVTTNSNEESGELNDLVGNSGGSSSKKLEWFSRDEWQTPIGHLCVQRKDDTMASKYTCCIPLPISSAERGQANTSPGKANHGRPVLLLQEPY